MQKPENEKEKEMKNIFKDLSEENKNILMLVANGIKVGQENVKN